MTDTLHPLHPQHAVSAITALEAELASLRRQLDHQDRLATVGTIAAGVVHELNNVLTPALAYAKLALRQPEDLELQRKANARCVEGIETASAILRAVLDFSGNPREDDRADVADTVASALRCLARDPARDAIEVSRRIPPGLRVRIDPLSLQQVLLNLLLNACRALRSRGGGAIRISTQARPGGLTRISVADDGPGIPTDLMEKIFEPFVSGAGGSTPEGQSTGAGLGLAVCRRIVENAGGSIRAARTRGGGASFHIELATATEVSAAQTA